jgi:hypothetical protein
VAEPIDSLLGFQILLRTPHRERLQLARESLELFFDTAAPASAPESEAAVRRLAVELAERVKREPGSFDELRAQYCCTGARVWREGREEAVIHSAVAALRPGQIAPGPVRGSESYQLVRRIDPAAALAQTPPVRFELPSPSAPAVLDLLGWQLEVERAQTVIRALGNAASRELGLPPPVSSRLLALHERAAALSDGQAYRARKVESMLQAVNTLLSDAELAHYERLAAHLLEVAVLEGAATSP